MTTATSTQPQSSGIAWPALIWIGALHLGALMAFNPAWFTWQALALCVFLHWVTGGVGITLTYHRLLTHRSFALRPRWLEYPLTIVGACASEGGAIGWVADHRCHHAHSDQDGDVHSPKRGFAWAHMLWWMTPDITSIHTEDYYARWAPDLARDKVHRFLDSYHFVFPLLSAVALYAIGGMPFLVWGFFVRSVAVLHTTWLVNSATHMWGYRTHETRDTSRNNWWVGLLAYGEGWHNNHHAFQVSARHGMRWWEIDVTYMMICAMKAVGIAYDVKLPKVTRGSYAAANAGETAPAKAATKAKRAVASRGNDEEPELVGAAN